MDYQKLIIKHLSGEIEPAEEDKLIKWLKQSPANRTLYQEFEEAWKQAEASNSIPHPDRVFGRIQAKVDNHKPARTKWSLLRVAAAILLLLTTAYLATTTTNIFEENGLKMVSTAKGEIKRVVLPDSTVVYLNTESRLHFPASFKEGSRKVILSGEGFFDVSHDARRPFSIQLDKGMIKVLGTSFNVKAYATEDIVKTSVSSGKVAFTTQDGQGDTTLIRPNEVLSYSKKEQHLEKEIADLKQNLAWMDNKIVFNANTLEEIAYELERYFDIQITFKDEHLKHCKMTGTFNKGSYQDILSTLTMTNTFEYRMEGKKLVLYGKGCQ